MHRRRQKRPNSQDIEARKEQFAKLGSQIIDPSYYQHPPPRHRNVPKDYTTIFPTGERDFVDGNKKHVKKDMCYLGQIDDTLALENPYDNDKKLYEHYEDIGFCRNLLTKDIDGASPSNTNKVTAAKKKQDIYKYDSNLFNDSAAGKRPDSPVRHYPQPGGKMMLPQDSEFLYQGTKKHFKNNINFTGQVDEIKALKNPFNDNNKLYELFEQHGLSRNLLTKDIDGAIPGTIQSKVVENKKKAQQLRQSQKQQYEQLKQQDQEAYENQYPDYYEKDEKYIRKTPLQNEQAKSYQDILKQQKRSSHERNLKQNQTYDSYQIYKDLLDNQKRENEPYMRKAGMPREDVNEEEKYFKQKQDQYEQDLKEKNERENYFEILQQQEEEEKLKEEIARKEEEIKQQYEQQKYEEEKKQEEQNKLEEEELERYKIQAEEEANRKLYEQGIKKKTEESYQDIIEKRSQNVQAQNQVYKSLDYKKIGERIDRYDQPIQDGYSSTPFGKNRETDKGRYYADNPSHNPVTNPIPFNCQNPYMGREINTLKSIGKVDFERKNYRRLFV